MSFDDDNELEDNSIFGLRFKATAAEQRELWLKLSTSRESREWGITRNLMQLVLHHTKTPELIELAERMENAEMMMTKLAKKLIDELLASRS